MDLHDAHVAAWVAWSHADLVAWYNETMEADHWFGILDVAPDQAAQLLCQINPNELTLEESQGYANWQTGPRDLLRLRQRFADHHKNIPRVRTLLDWLALAGELGLKYHTWIIDYLGRPNRLAQALAQLSAPADTQRKRVSRAEAEDLYRIRRHKRLELLESIGGSVGKSRINGLAELERRERGKPGSSRKTIEKDLRKAQEERRDRQRQGQQLDHSPFDALVKAGR